MGHAQLLRRRFFEGGDLLAKNELLIRKHPAKRIQQFVMDGSVLALQIEHDGTGVVALRRLAPGRLSCRGRRAGRATGLRCLAQLDAISRGKSDAPMCRRAEVAIL